MAELFTKQVIARALDVETQSQKPIARINAARLLARIVEQNTDAGETRADVLARLAGTNQGDLADALSAIIKDPGQNDGARFWAFRALRLMLALPQPTPPMLPRDKEEAALGTVLKFLKDRNKPFPPGAAQEEIDGFRYLRREAIAALAQCRYPTLTDKSRPTFVLLKVAARDGVAPEPGVAERVEAAIGVAHAQPAFDKDKDYQPDYAAHQLGLFVADFVGRYGEDKQANPDGPAAQPWKVQASRLIEALELMKVQSEERPRGPRGGRVYGPVEEGRKGAAGDEPVRFGAGAPGRGVAGSEPVQGGRRFDSEAGQPQGRRDGGEAGGEEGEVKSGRRAGGVSPGSPALSAHPSLTVTVFVSV